MCFEGSATQFGIGDITKLNDKIGYARKRFIIYRQFGELVSSWLGRSLVRRLLSGGRQVWLTFARLNRLPRLDKALYAAVRICRYIGSLNLPFVEDSDSCRRFVDGFLWNLRYSVCHVFALCVMATAPITFFYHAAHIYDSSVCSCYASVSGCSTSMPTNSSVTKMSETMAVLSIFVR